MQQRFSFAGLVGGALIAVLIGLVAWKWRGEPDRFAMAPVTVAFHAEPIAVNATAVAPLRLAGGWRLTAPDPRFGGMSALAVDRGRLVALNDSGVVFRFTPPDRDGREIEIRDLPAGPGSPHSKENRDSESLTRDPAGRGWWVGFETSNQLWLYASDFGRPLQRMDLKRGRWPRNRGLEAMAAIPTGLRLIPERAPHVMTITGGRAMRRPLPGISDSVSDMVRLPNGETLVLMRGLGLSGFDNALGALVETRTGWRIERRVPLDLGAFMNVEGVAAEPLANGSTRLWLITDDGFRLPMTTALFALDVGPGRWPGPRKR